MAVENNDKKMFRLLWSLATLAKKN